MAQILELAFAFSKWDYDSLDRYTKRFSKNQYGREMSLFTLMQESLDEFETDEDEFRLQLEKSLNLGRMLVLVAGDKIRNRAFDILTALDRYPALGFEIAMIELECFQCELEQRRSLLIVPRLAQKSEIVERSVVEVKIKEGQSRPEVDVSRVKKTKAGGGKTLTETEFWEKLKDKAPDDYQRIKEFVDDLKSDPLIEILPGSNGLRFKRVLPESDRNISLFFITTDSLMHVRLQAPLKQFEALGLDRTAVDEYGREIKQVLNGFSAPFNRIDVSYMKSALSNFIERIDEILSIHGPA